MENQLGQLSKAIAFLAEFRKLDSEMQMQTALIFLLIAKDEGCSVRDLEQLTGLTSASCSRNVAALSDVGRKGNPGHNLVAVKVDADDRRQRNLFLTTKGRAVLASALEGFRNAD
ncbi:MarR family winged helix-turn-helix transcriptional regulator [Mesorhizobium sp. ES1-3]|uniref:MarR family winged helix-turn-helix transcriptional regulator n=1 Tax=Mesorhizobium sp. ES1-3 TaxID=2876628 RepID=UPI001CCF2654|nr:MarR family winged helix-turn-helix transcriptional regulator [Mesorhizobium sp. ES1-3]MBZ9671648.1 MarR family winged helix-turn-helix transcriptional regulator [Mesorhizobium sp. ES1-3]